MECVLFTPLNEVSVIRGLVCVQSIEWNTTGQPDKSQTEQTAHDSTPYIRVLITHSCKLALLSNKLIKHYLDISLAVVLGRQADANFY